MSAPEFAYDQSMFDAGYYGGGARGGFRSYVYGSHEQQQQLSYKLRDCHLGGNFGSILFVGCAKGYEVRYFGQHGKFSSGVDISQYAIEHADPEAKPYVQLYDGRNIPHKDNSYDMVAAFDVLTLVPDGMIQDLTADMVRVAKDKILVRTITKNWRNMDQEWDGNDGVTYKYKTFAWWDELFSRSGKFAFHYGQIAYQYEGIYIWRAV